MSLSSLSVIDIVVTLAQDGDSNQGPESTQQLIVRLENAGAGPYLVIESDRWAMDSVVELSGDLAVIWERCACLFSKLGKGQP